MIVDHSREVVEPELGYLGERHTLAGRAVGEDHVEGADAVGGDDEQRFAAVGQFDVVEVADLAAALVGERQIRLHHECRHAFSL